MRLINNNVAKKPYNQEKHIRDLKICGGIGGRRTTGGRLYIASLISYFIYVNVRTVKKIIKSEIFNNIKWSFMACEIVAS